MDTTAVSEILRREFREDNVYAAPSLKQLQLMNRLISESLVHKDNRIPVIRKITGLSAITSSKQLTRHTVGILIDYLYDEEAKEITDEGRNFICEIEASLAG